MFKKMIESEPRYTTIVSCLRIPVLYATEYLDVLEMVYEMFVFKQQKIIINQHRVSDPPPLSVGGGEELSFCPLLLDQLFSLTKKRKTRCVRTT
jgi:hypothetical protein